MKKGLKRANLCLLLLAGVWPTQWSKKLWSYICIFEIDVVKSLTQSIKNLCQLDFFEKGLTVLFVLIYVL